MAPAKKKQRVRKKEKVSAKSSQQQQQQPSPPPPSCAETSPDSKCPICLDRFVNVASVNRCLHRFCFHCIREWAKNKAECPLCKQPFHSIFHSVKSENDFKEFVVLKSAQSATTSESATVTLTAAAISATTAGQNNAESAATQTRRSRATRTGQRRSPRDQDPSPSASSTESMPQLHDTLIQQGPALLQNLLSWLHGHGIMETSNIRPYMQSQGDRILHEMLRFARSFGPMQSPPAPSQEEDVGSPSSIINISEDEGDSVAADVTEDNTQDVMPPVPVPTSSEISLSQSAWDDETPGPSYSTLSHPQMEEAEPEENQLGGTGAVTEQRERNDDENNEEEECMIVGYVKPMAERTPELVQLSSDSTELEEEEGGDQAAAMETVMKAETSLPCDEQAPLSPMSFPSTSHTERGENLEPSTERDPGKLSHQRLKGRDLRRGFRRPEQLLSGSHSQTSSESSPQSERLVTINSSHVGLSRREPRRRSHHALGRSPTGFADRDGSSSDELLPTRSVLAQRDKSSKSFSPWDSPSHDSERKRRKRKRRKEREPERSRSPHRETRNRHGDRELWLCSSSSSSDVDSRREKPSGKRKYKTRHLERTARRRSSRKSCVNDWERERSPSVEIIFERRAADTHSTHSTRSKSRKHKKRIRRKEKIRNSPTIITIQSDSSSNHTDQAQAGANGQAEANVQAEASGQAEANIQTEASGQAEANIQTEASGQAEPNSRVEANPQTEANSHTTDFRNQLTDDDIDDVDNDHTADSQHHDADHNEHVTDFSDHTIDYQEQLA